MVGDSWGTRVNWKTLTTSFRVGGVTVSLQGDPGLSRTMVSLKTMLRDIHEEHEGLRVELGHITVQDSSNTLELPDSIWEVV